MCLGGNPGLTRLDETNSEEPDSDHSTIHDLFVRAISIAPKTDEGASTVSYLLRYMPESATDGAYPRDLGTALEAWNVEVLLEPDGTYKGGCYSRSLATEDGMTPSERVQFHLLRHYWTKEIGFDSESRVQRLAAYATVPVSKEFFDNFQKYADRDGAAFVYATSFNKSIWQSREYVQAFLRICPRYFLGKGTITILEDMTAVYEIRESVAPGWAKESEPEISDNEARRLDMSNYEKVLYDSKSSSDNFFLKSAALGVILFCFGLWALYEQSTVMPVLARVRRYRGCTADIGYL